ncbi:class I SAM-dependent methyltransferase [Cryptosporangium sp. NPDC051539]|uniref:class I SAM-dependent methyltransferase n=1 Tax=Cryptosporangium sp. NPDC051539 TaxID=3363962 RepID=UPI0037A4BD2A
MMLLNRAFAAVYDPFLALGEKRTMGRQRAELLATAKGDVLELGAGTGLNLGHYPEKLTTLTVSEPDAAMRARLQRRAGRVRTSYPVTVSPDRAEALSFPDAAFDAVVSTLVLCTVQDPAATLTEVRRVLRPGGRLLLIEHVSAPAGSRLARWQRRSARPWKAFAGGCRCDQGTVRLLTDAGFSVAALKEETWTGMPKIVAPLVVGSIGDDVWAC